MTDTNPLFSARLPWIGPILGTPCDARAARVSLGAGADPLRGNAIAAVLLPVHRDDAERRGAWQAALVARVRSGENGLFRIDAPGALWAPPAEGVLLVLLYALATDPWHPVYADAFGAALADAAPALIDQELSPFPSLPEPIRSEIRQRVGELLAQPGASFEEGFVRPAVAPPPGKIAFAVASCQYPAGFLDGGVAAGSYARLAASLEREGAGPRPQCVLLLGDQVYVDATAGLFDPSALYDRFELPYERLLRMDTLRAVLRRIPAYTMLDDHEIEDNWDPAAGSAGNLDAGRRAYLAYQRLAGPAPAAPDSLWYAFEANGFPFFVADTRTERDARNAAKLATARIMGERQFTELLRWLDRWKHSDVPKFIASPACPLPRHARAITHEAAALRSDAWDGFPFSLHALLAHIARERIRNVVFLSGDEHVSFIARGTLRGGASGEEVVVHSIHSSALYSPFPFANSVTDSLAFKDTFQLGASPYSCEVSMACRAPGDGFALLEARLGNGQAQLRCRFDRASGESDWVEVF